MKRTLAIVGCLALLVCALSLAGRPTPQNDDAKKLVDVKGDVMYPIKVADSSAICIVGNVVFYHNGTVITCDSAIRYSANYMECHKNVMLNKDDTYAYGDKADYNGRQNIANIYSPLIKVRNGDAVLYTHNFKFNTKTNIGEYWGMGVVFDDDNTMESERGFFYADQNMMICVDRVQLKNSDYRMISDSITYNTDTDEARFYTRSYIWNNKDEILSSDQGVYNNETKVYSFFSDAYILTETREVWADTLLYYGQSQDVDMYGNIQVYDDEHSMMSFGDLGKYWDLRGETMLTRHPSVFTYDKNTDDTTFMRADTMYLYVYYPSDFKDSLSTGPAEESPQIDPYAHLRWIDSLEVERRRVMADSLSLILAQTKAYMDSLRVVADSIELYANPEELARTLKLKARKDSIAAAKVALRDSFYSLSDKDKQKFANAYNKARKAEAKAAAKKKLAEEKAKWEAEQARIKAQIEAQRIKDKAKEDSLKAAYKAEIAAEKARIKEEKAKLKAQKKAVIETQQRMDSIRQTADSLKADSTTIVKDSLNVATPQDSVAVADTTTTQTDTVAIKTDTVVVEPSQTVIIEQPAPTDTTQRIRTERKIVSADSVLMPPPIDSLPLEMPMPTDSTVVEMPKQPVQHIVPPEATAVRARLDSVRPRNDSLTKVESYIRQTLPADTLPPKVDSAALALRDSVARADSLRRVDSLRFFNKDAYKRILKRKQAMEQARKQAIKDSIQAIKDSIQEAKYIAKLKAKGLWVDPDTVAVDTLDSLSMAPVVDSLEVKVDTTTTEQEVDTIQRVIRGFHNVKIFKGDMQAITDSLAAFSKDSTIVMYKSPIIWNGLNQITSSQATFYTDGSESITRGFFEGDPVMAAQVDDDHFNQVSGKTMTAFFRDNTVYRNDVNSNAQALYWMQEEGSPDIIAYATLIAADITFLLANQTVTHINGYTNSEWTIYPPEKIPDDVTTHLDWFKWQIDRKPTRQDVFDRSIRRSRRADYERRSQPRFPISLRINNKRAHLQKYYKWVDRNDVLTDQTLEWVNSVKSEYEK